MQQHSTAEEGGAYYGSDLLRPMRMRSQSKTAKYCLKNGTPNTHTSLINVSRTCASKPDTHCVAGPTSTCTQHNPKHHHNKSHHRHTKVEDADGDR
jgi:hypothetical protein